MSAEPRTRLAVIIVSYNSSALLRACLRSLLTAARAADWLETHVIVVDNASADGSAALVAREFPQVQLAALDANLGFTGGNNHALRLLGLLDTAHPAQPAPDFVLLLNPDTEIVGDALAQLVRFLQATPRAGICGPALRYGDGAFQHAAFAFPGLAQAALDLLPVHRLPFGARLYSARLNGRYAQTLWERGQPFAVDFVLGAALLARAAVVRAIGGLDDGYFMYCEEMDWCLRAHAAGWGVYAVPAAQIIHHEAQSSRQVRWPAYARLWQSRLRFYRLHRDRLAPGTLPAVRALLRLTMGVGARQAWLRFARGAATGADAAAEMRARQAIAHAARE